MANLSDIKKDKDFVRQLELAGISSEELKIPVEGLRKGTLKTMSSSEKSYILSMCKEHSINECLTGLKENYGKVYTYQTIHYWLKKVEVPATNTYNASSKWTPQLEDSAIKLFNTFGKVGKVREVLNKEYHTSFSHKSVWKKLKEYDECRAQIHTKVSWTPLMEEKLIELWNTGDSCAKISRRMSEELGTTVSTYAIQHRAKLLAKRGLIKNRRFSKAAKDTQAKKKNVFARIFDAIFNS